MKNKIGIFKDWDLYTILKNYFDDIELVFFEVENNFEVILRKIQENKIRIVILDSRFPDFIQNMKKFKSFGIKVILTEVMADYKVIRDCFKFGLIYDFFEKGEYSELKNILKSFSEEVSEERDKLIIKEGAVNGTIVKIADIYMIAYDRESKKSLIYAAEKELKSKKSLQEVEEIFSRFYDFFRADRSSIINLRKIVGFEEEYVIFENGKRVFFNRQVVKNIWDAVFGLEVMEI